MFLFLFLAFTCLLFNYLHLIGVIYLIVLCDVIKRSIVFCCVVGWFYTIVFIGFGFSVIEL